MRKRVQISIASPLCARLEYLHIAPSQPGPIRFLSYGPIREELCGTSNKRKLSRPRLRRYKPRHLRQLLSPSVHHRPRGPASLHLAIQLAWVPACISKVSSPARRTCRLTATWKARFRSTAINSPWAPPPCSLPKFAPGKWWSTAKSSAISTPATASMSKPTARSSAIFPPLASASRTAPISRAASKSTRPNRNPPQTDGVWPAHLSFCVEGLHLPVPGAILALCPHVPPSQLFASPASAVL